ncbi:Uncharacterized protein ALO82_04612, partial [Pseudomonas syringae pv. broussonetiae]
VSGRHVTQLRDAVGIVDQAVTADAELTHVTTWLCPISIQPKVRPANALRSRSLGQRNFDTWVNSASAATSNGTENQRKAWLEFANPLRLRGLANFDFLNEFMAPLFRVISPVVALAEAVS